MIFKALEKSAKEIIFKPYILLPMLIVAIVSFLSNQLNGILFQRILSDIVLHGDVMSELDPIILLLTNYPTELVIMIISGIVVLFVTIIAMVSIAKFANGKSIVESINDSVLSWKENLGLTIFILAMVVLLFGIWGGAILLANGIDFILGGILSEVIYFVIVPIVSVALVIIFAVKLSFVIPSFAEGSKIREAIEESWEFTYKKFWSTFAFIVILLIIVFLVAWIFDILAVNILELELPIVILGEMIYSTFFVVGISNYFYSK
jgi:hypothetical protein